MSIIDISVPLKPDMPTWPDSVGLRLTRTMSLEAGDKANVSRLDCDVHMGTHVDAPWHFLDDGSTVDAMSLDVLIGPAIVADLTGTSAVTPSDLTGLKLAPNIRRLLLKTRNSALWAAGVTEFKSDYVALSADAARWVVERGIRLIGIDYLSVQRYGDDPLTHQILMRAGVIIVEGLNLAGVQPGLYELICLPIRLVGTDGAPVRAVLRTLPPTREAEGVSNKDGKAS
ncbi:MAG TPA: cyclase family protein [Candidatus Eisenbacteria bacterium]|nr:cyclase family protein [Candidatus Eisenbacteria bacterium]